MELSPQEEEELALRVEEAVQQRVAQTMASKEVQQQIQERLKAERARLEEKVQVIAFFVLDELGLAGGCFIFSALFASCMHDIAAFDQNAA